jgi:hypothetical protein
VSGVALLCVIFADIRVQFTAMNRATDVNRLKPIIDRVFPFDDAIGTFA